MDKQVIDEIKHICGKAQQIRHVGCLFKLGYLDCMYMDYQDPYLLKFTIPCLVTVEDGDKTHAIKIINEVNREIKYVKAFILDNGCVSLVYERRIIDGEKTSSIVSHVIKTLDYSSEHVMQKMTRQKK